RQLGGALGRPAEDAGALDRIDARFILFAVGIPMDAAMGAAVVAHAERVVSAVEPWGRRRAYLNFAERPTASVTAFDEDAHARLLATRARYDGRSMMRANHRIEG
ncbi:MAG: FAD-linked oxidase, partial [Thermoleophilia bacterium]|nr:FAD-linked oxidase [Thermoleophilia bacterium]